MEKVIIYYQHSLDMRYSKKYVFKAQSLVKNNLKNFHVSEKFRNFV